MISKLNLSGELGGPGYVSQKLHFEVYPVICSAVTKRNSEFVITYVNVEMEMGKYLDYMNHVE